MRESEFLEGMDHLVARLRKIPAFQDFNDERLKGMLRFSKVRVYSAGETIILEGEFDHHMYFIISGQVVIRKGGRTLLTLRRCGDVFGEMGMLDIEPRSATVEALSETTCLALDSKHLEEMEEDGKNCFHSLIYRMFAEILAQRLRQTTAKYFAVKEELDGIKARYKLP